MKGFKHRLSNYKPAARIGFIIFHRLYGNFRSIFIGKHKHPCRNTAKSDTVYLILICQFQTGAVTGGKLSAMDRHQFPLYNRADRMDHIFAWQIKSRCDFSCSGRFLTLSDAYSVVYSPEALEDLRGIYSYIAFTLLVPETVENQVNRIRKEVRSLDFMPSRHSLVDWEPWKSMGVHKVPIDNFVIYYTVNDDSRTVTVIRIFYGGRDVANIANVENE